MKEVKDKDVKDKVRNMWIVRTEIWREKNEILKRKSEANRYILHFISVIHNFREVFNQIMLLNGPPTTGHRCESKFKILDLSELSQGMSREAEMIETYVRGLEAGRQSALAGGRWVKKKWPFLNKRQFLGLIFQWEGEEVMVQLRLVIVAMGSFFSLFVNLEVIEIL